ncbi:hypothetical protein NDU88_004422 [Pleurodeles waltl]|uniref:Uncharacterized protein n=1 Tax=Pleurodeles waltl TaxID=8319 RepID=A0AAV7TSI6_PLEWA|nr:hypothetical protein NDU88_004422 [Pleurodeles waltl]
MGDDLFPGPPSSDQCIFKLSPIEGPGGPRLIPAAIPAQLPQGRTDPAGMICVRFSGATHSVPAILRPAKQGPVGSGATRSTPHWRGTPAVRVPWRSRGFSQWRVQWGTRTEPARREQVRPAAPYKGRDVAPRPRIFSGHRVQDSSVPDSGIHRSIGRGQQPALGRRTRTSAAVRRSYGSPGRARSVRSAARSSPPRAGDIPSAAAHVAGRPGRFSREEC